MAGKRMETREQMLARLRKTMAEKSTNRRDPDQFTPPQVQAGESVEYYFRVLPPLAAGDTYVGGVAEKDEDLWFYENGSHWMQSTKLECPRIHDKNECPLCQTGFDLMEDNDDKKYRSRIAQMYLPQQKFAVNVYFLNTDKNPEKLRGRVMWFSMPKTVYQLMDDCINNDNTGDEQDPRAAGIFYHPYEGGYTFKLVVEHDNGFNSYDKSNFLPASFGPLAKNKDGSPNEEAINKILNQRFYLPGKFRARDIEKLKAMVAKIYDKETSTETEEIGVGTAATSQVVKTPTAAPVRTAPVVEAVEENMNLGQEVVQEEIVQAKPIQAKPTTQTAKPTAKPTQTAKPTAKPAPVRPVAEAPIVDEGENDPELAKLLHDISN